MALGITLIHRLQLYCGLKEGHLDSTKQEIHEAVTRIIGEDEPDIPTHIENIVQVNPKNTLRAEQRLRLKAELEGK